MYADGIYDLIVFDEFQGQKPIGQLNALTDGFTTPLVRRGTHPYLKNDKLPVIICSNKLPHDVYNKTTDRAYVDAFASRYLILDFYEAGFTGKIDIEIQTASNEAVILPSDNEEEEEPQPVRLDLLSQAQSKFIDNLETELKKRHLVIDVPMDSD